MILEANFRGALSIDNFPCPTEPDYKQVAAKVNATTTELKADSGLFRPPGTALKATPHRLLPHQLRRQSYTSTGNTKSVERTPLRAISWSYLFRCSFSL